MGCPRCQGLMVSDECVDYLDSADISVVAWRCVICGEMLDPIIMEHRRVQREPMIGRARVSLKARFVSAHKFKRSERDGEVGTIPTEQRCRL